MFLAELLKHFSILELALESRLMKVSLFTTTSHKKSSLSLSVHHAKPLTRLSLISQVADGSASMVARF
jgi:hypothetical protein